MSEEPALLPHQLLCCSDVKKRFREVRQKSQLVSVFFFYLFVYFLCGLGVAECNRGQVFEDRHLDGAITSIQERHQGAWMHWPIHDLGPNTWIKTEEWWDNGRGFRQSLVDSLLQRFCSTAFLVYHFTLKVQIKNTIFNLHNAGIKSPGETKTDGQYK